MSPDLSCDVRRAEHDDSFIMKRHALEVATLVLAAAVLAAATSAHPARASEQLPALGADVAATSVSGLSSGAYMAGQIEVAHSSQIVGAGIVAGGPFACAETEASKLIPFWPMAVAQNAQQALYKCMKTTLGLPDPKASAERAKELADEGKIDPLSGLAKDNIYLFSGNEDQTVARAVVEAARDFFKEVGVPETNITLVENKGGHAFITEEGGAACGVSASPYVSDCDYDQAKRYSPGSMARSRPRLLSRKGRFIPFDQQVFAKPGDGLADEGVVYVPPACTVATRLPRPYRPPWLRAVARNGRRRLHQGVRLRPGRRHEPVRHPLPADQGERDQPARLLGLVGLYRPRLSR
jgi:hypothetical protein